MRRPTAPVNDWVLWLPLLYQHHGTYLRTLLERLVSSDVVVQHLVEAVWYTNSSYTSVPERIHRWLRDNGYTEDADAAELVIAVITMKKSEV